MVSWLLVGPALAVRPYTTVGFDAADVVEFADNAAGDVRVHYAVSGPSVTVLDDDDQDGVPDFATDVLLTADASLALYADLGLRPLVLEAEFGIDGGGSSASDVYMIDFQIGADGSWRSEACDDVSCAGYLVADHRFASYPNPSTGVAIVIPHELFHGIQAAYATDFPVWMSEGTATWAEQQYLPDNFDFLGFSGAYLEDVTRPVDRPPGGPVPAFAYGTALFFDFLTLRHDPELMTELLTLASIDLLADPDADLMGTIDAALQARGDDLQTAFVEFARFNLATGPRSGGIPSYPYAALLQEPRAEERAAFLDTRPRYFDYAMVFHRLDHPGGPAGIWWEEDAPPVHLELFPTNGNAVQPSIWTGSPTASVTELGDLPAGTYWLLGTVAERIPQSISVRTCIGALDQVEACSTPEPGDTDTPGDEEPEGCGCRTAGPVSPLWVLVPLGLLGARRRR